MYKNLHEVLDRFNEIFPNRLLHVDESDTAEPKQKDERSMTINDKLNSVHEDLETIIDNVINTDETVADLKSRVTETADQLDELADAVEETDDTVNEILNTIQRIYGSLGLTTIEDTLARIERKFDNLLAANTDDDDSQDDPDTDWDEDVLDTYLDDCSCKSCLAERETRSVCSCTACVEERLDRANRLNKTQAETKEPLCDRTNE